jgi:hypothetical protein
MLGSNPWTVATSALGEKMIIQYVIEIIWTLNIEGTVVKRP